MDNYPKCQLLRKSFPSDVAQSESLQGMFSFWSILNVSLLLQIVALWHSGNIQGALAEADDVCKGIFSLTKAHIHGYVVFSPKVVTLSNLL
jgi:hypothetical protein